MRFGHAALSTPGFSREHHVTWISTIHMAPNISECDLKKMKHRVCLFDVNNKESLRLGGIGSAALCRAVVEAVVMLCAAVRGCVACCGGGGE